MQKKQSAIRNAKTIGILLIYLRFLSALIVKESSFAYKLRNQGSDATDSWTSTVSK